MDSILLSIIIPTKNRQKYLQKCVDEILSIGDNRIQIVIQDNSDEAGLADKLPLGEKKINIKYNYTPGTISFVDNFSLAVEAADGIYSCIIGDDDGITEYIGDVTAWANKNNIEAIKPEILFEYFWPNSINVKGLHHEGLIRLLDSNIKATFFCPYTHLKRLVKNGGQDYTTLDVGKLYHGIVKTKVLRQIKERTGKYFGGLSPDIYMAVALSITLQNAVKLSFPLTIAGACKTSGSADSSNGRHVGPLNTAPHLRGHNSYCWSKEVPEFYSVETIWADSALAALYDFDQNHLIKQFSIPNLDACCARRYQEYNKEIRDHYKGYQKSSPFFKRINNSMHFYTYPIIHFLHRVIRRVSRVNKKLILVDFVPDITAANKYFQKRCFEKGITGELLISVLNQGFEGKQKDV